MSYSQKVVVAGAIAGGGVTGTVTTVVVGVSLKAWRFIAKPILKPILSFKKYLNLREGAPKPLLLFKLTPEFPNPPVKATSVVTVPLEGL